MTVGTEHRYIVRDDDILSGEPIIVGTRVAVRAVVELWRLGVAPEEILTHLSHLTLAQVFDALSYYAPGRDPAVQRPESGPGRNRASARASGCLTARQCS